MNFSHHHFDRFFKDNHGKWAIFQFPNALLSAWIILAVLAMPYPNLHIKILQNCVLFAWAYLELTEGSSLFRKVLGAVVLGVVVYGVILI